MPARQGESGPHSAPDLFERAHDYALVSLDAEGRVVRWSAGAERITGRSAAEAVGRSFEAVLPAERAEESAGAREEAVRSGHARIDGWKIRADGSRYWASGSITAVGEERNPSVFAVVLEDTTEQRRADEALRASEELFTGILEIATDAVVSVNEAQEIIIFNQGAEKTFGYRAEEVLGKRLELLIPERFRTPHERLVHEFGRSGVQARQMGERGQIFGLRKDGEEFPAEASISRLEIDGGRVYTAVLRDVTERRRAEQALRISEARFSGIISLASDAIVSVNQDQRIVLFNRGAETIFGYRAEEVLGERLELLIPERLRGGHEGDVRRFAESGVEAREMGERGEIMGRRKGGEEFPAEASISQLDLAGEKLLTAVLRDVTERKRAEEELDLLRTVAIAIGEAEDLNAALSVALEKICQATGWATGDAWLPDADDEALEHAQSWPRDVERLRPFQEQSVARAFHPGEGLIGHVWQESSPKWVRDIGRDEGFVRREGGLEAGLRHAVAIPVLADEHVVAVVAFYNFDVREEDARLVNLVTAVAAQLGSVIQRKRAEEALARQANELARSNAELEQFAYVASHDLQEPLRMVASYTQLLSRRYKGKLDEDADEFISYAVDGVVRMQSLINDLLAFSRVGTRGGTFEPTDAEAVFSRALSSLGPAIEETKAVVTHDPLPTLTADAGQLGQVFLNLIGNAIKFRGEEPPRIHVGAEREEEGWHFTVRDNGIGIEPEFAERIFVLFQRLHSRMEYPGTGIGLAICRKIVERHDGRIWMESEPGSGSTFHFTIPDL